MKFEKFEPKKKETVAWYLKVDAEIDGEFQKFQEEHGKINKTRLVEWLLGQYIKQFGKDEKQ